MSLHVERNWKLSILKLHYYNYSLQRKVDVEDVDFFVFILALTVNDIKESSGRQRHHSAVSTEDEEEISEKMTVIEARMAVEINDGSFSWDLTNKEPVIQKYHLQSELK
jgi:hypothetical protein